MSGPPVYSFAAVSEKYGVHKVGYTHLTAGSAEYWKYQFPDCGKVWIEPLIPQSAYDTLRAQLKAAESEVSRLTGCLTQANHNSEEFERKWYLAGDEADDYGSQRDAAIARAEAAEANAARYEWLRENDQERSDVFLANSHEELDAAIDAAMSRTKEKKDEQ